jgi:hypothetical protein
MAISKDAARNHDALSPNHKSTLKTTDVEPAPLRLVLGSQALQSTVATLRKRIEGFEAQAALAASTDLPAEK